MTAASSLAASIITVVDGLFYYISKPVFAFPLIKIVFLMVKLVMWGQEL